MACERGVLTRVACVGADSGACCAHVVKMRSRKQFAGLGVRARVTTPYRKGPLESEDFRLCQPPPNPLPRQLCLSLWASTHAEEPTEISPPCWRYPIRGKSSTHSRQCIATLLRLPCRTHTTHCSQCVLHHAQHHAVSVHKSQCSTSSVRHSILEPVITHSSWLLPGRHIPGVARER